MQFLKALLFIVSFHIGTPLWAAEAALEMVHIKSSVSDLLAKIEVISQAQKSIDVVTYHHDDTKSSFLLMEALRMAALRGVQVRYIYDRMATQKGSSDFSEAYLNILRKAGVQMRALTVLERFKKWRFFKIIHSKQIIADAGENRRVSVFGGRNAGDRYLHWIDNTFVMTWPKGSFLDKKISEYFELLWGALPGYVDEKKYTTVPERMFSNEKELKQAVLANLESDDKNRVLQEAVDVSRLLVREKAQVLPYFEFAENEVDFLSSG
ncbi:MAG: phospholipase D-like domain-containing protein, partial [Bdellovibrio sp.]